MNLKTHSTNVLGRYIDTDQDTVACGIS
jgi:hypothetical protein